MFNRVAVANVTTPDGEIVELTGLRMAFKITKTLTRTANIATLDVYNLTKTTRNLIGKVNNVLALSVGYSDEGGSSVLFVGDITRFTVEHQPPDIVVHIEASDGQIVLRETRVSLSFSKDTAALTVFNQIVDELEDVTLRPLPSLGGLSFKNGFSFTGNVGDALDKVCTALGLEWSIQNGELQVLERGKALSSESVLISPGTGLIGAPERDDDQGVATTGTKEAPGWTFRSLLNSLLEPGCLVKLESAENDGGIFRLKSVLHRGDTHGQDWYSQAEVFEEAE